MPQKPLQPGDHGHIPEPRQTGPKKWQASCRYRQLDGTTVRVIREGPNKTAARRALDAALYELMGKAPKTDLRPHSRVSEAADLWIRHIEQQCRATTAETYERLLRNHVRPGIGALRLREASPAVLQTFFDSLRDKKLAPSTRRTIKTVVLGIFQHALDKYGAIPDNPAMKIGRIRGDGKKAPRSLTPQERRDLLAKLAADEKAVAHDLPDLVTFMLGTGVRIGECIAVRWGDFALADVVAGDGSVQQIPVVHVNGNVVRVTGQGLVRHPGKSEAADRVVPLPQFVVEMLAARRPDDAPEERPVFTSSAMTYRDARNTARSLRGARERAGYLWVVSHAFRKTAVSEWRRMGLDSTMIADLAGHAQVSMTEDVYFGRRQLHARAAIAMDEAWSGADRVS